MKEEDLTQLTTDKIEANLKEIKGVTGALIGVLVLLFAVTIYGLFTSENRSTFIALIAVGVACSAILPMQFQKAKQLQKELENRSNPSVE